MKSLIVVLLLAVSSHASENRVAAKLFINEPLTDIKVQGQDRDGTASLGLGAEYQRQITPHISLGGEIDNLGRGENVSGSFVNNVQASVSGSVLAGLFMARYDLSDAGSKLRPYVSAGAGMARVSLHATGVPAAGFSWASGGNATKTVVDDAQVAGVFTLRGGTDISLGDRASLGLEIGLVRTTSVSHPLTADGQALFGNGASITGPEQSVIFGATFATRF